LSMILQKLTAKHTTYSSHDVTQMGNGKSIALIVSAFGTIGTLFFLIKILPAFILALQGDYANATDVAANVGVGEIISELRWAIMIAVVGPIAGLLVGFLKRLG